jgi:dynein heavy chain 1
LKETLNKIQKAVDDLSLRQYSNLHAWVGKLDEAVEAKLALRLQVSYRMIIFNNTLIGLFVVTT